MDKKLTDRPLILFDIVMDYKAAIVQQAPQTPWDIGGDALQLQSMYKLGGVVNIGLP